MPPIQNPMIITPNPNTAPIRPNGLLLNVTFLATARVALIDRRIATVQRSPVVADHRRNHVALIGIHQAGPILNPPIRFHTNADRRLCAYKNNRRPRILRAKYYEGASHEAGVCDSFEACALWERDSEPEKPAPISLAGQLWRRLSAGELCPSDRGDVHTYR